ncbi:MAG: SLOG family protein [Clostridia bacterium]|nr:SLOG family protein [Clostridia bacterium]
MTAGVCSFTGHRQIPESDRAPLSDLLKRAIAYAYEKDCKEFLTGGAIGFDTLAAREVVLFRITHPDVKLRLILPCTDQDRHWDEKQKSSYRYLLSVADDVVYLRDEYTPDCMKLRNRYLADACDMLVAYITHDRSGASQTARMAREQGKPVFNLAGELSRTPEEKPAD